MMYAYAIEAKTTRSRAPWRPYIVTADATGTGEHAGAPDEYARAVLEEYLGLVAADAGAERGDPQAEPCTELRVVVWHGDEPRSLRVADAVLYYTPPGMEAADPSGRLGPLTENEGRVNAANDRDPLMLIGCDILHYAECLIRFHDHPPLSEGYQFWGNLADQLNRWMHFPANHREKTDGDWSAFNGAVAMAVAYVRDVSPASDEVKLALLHRYFAPERA